MPNISARFTPNRLLNYSKPEIIKEIRRVILDECKGNVPSQTQFLKLARISHWTIRTKFGTYAQAIQKAGFVHEDTRTRFTPERVTSNLHEVLRRADGYCFSYHFYGQNGGSYSFQTIKSILNIPNWAGVLETIAARPQPHLVRISAHAQRLKKLANLTKADLLQTPAWWALPTELAAADYAWKSWFLTFAALGVTLSGARDALAAGTLARVEESAPLNVGAVHLKFLIAGGTGFIGATLTRRLVACGHEVTLVARNPARAALQFGGAACMPQPHYRPWSTSMWWSISPAHR